MEAFPTQSRPMLVRFGAFEADLQTGELRKDGVKLRGGVLDRVRRLYALLAAIEDFSLGSCLGFTERRDGGENIPCLHWSRHAEEEGWFAPQRLRLRFTGFRCLFRRSIWSSVISWSGMRSRCCSTQVCGGCFLFFGRRLRG